MSITDDDETITTTASDQPMSITDDDETITTTASDQPVKLFEFPPPPQDFVPSLRDILTERNKASLIILLAPIPLIIFLLFFALESMFFTLRETDSKDPTIYHVHDPTSTLQIILKVLGAFGAMTGFTIVIPLALRIPLSKLKGMAKIMFGYLISVILGNIAAAYFINNGSSPSIRYVFTGVLPVIFALILGKHFRNYFPTIIPNLVIPKKMPYHLTAVATFTALILIVYDTLIVKSFFDASVPLTTKLLLRLVVHPIVLELVFLPWRSFAQGMFAWCTDKDDQSNDETSEFVKKTALEYVVLPTMVSFSMLGRFIIAQVPSFWSQVLFSFILALEDQVLRSTVIFRDRFFFQRLEIPNSGATFYANLYLYDELLELSSIMLAGVMTLMFRLAASESSPIPNWWELVLSTLIAIALEVGAEYLRITYYIKVFKPPPLTTKMNHFVNKLYQFYVSVEYFVHRAWQQRSDSTITVIAVCYLALGMWIYANTLSPYLCGKIQPDGTVSNFYCAE